MPHVVHAIGCEQSVPANVTCDAFLALRLSLCSSPESLLSSQNPLLFTPSGRSFPPLGLRLANESHLSRCDAASGSGRATAGLSRTCSSDRPLV
jgi:hypothetical protein